MKETWKDVPGFEGTYQVSSAGRIKNIKTGNIKALNKWGPYFGVNLVKNGQRKRYEIHRLVGLVFLDNPNNLPLVGHKDDNCENNHVDNLYWTDYQENNTHNGLRQSREGKIKAMNIEDGTILSFDSLRKAAEKGFVPSCIIACLNGRSKTHKRYVWRYEYIAK